MPQRQLASKNPSPQWAMFCRLLRRPPFASSPSVEMKRLDSCKACGRRHIDPHCWEACDRRHIGTREHLKCLTTESTLERVLKGNNRADGHIRKNEGGRISSLRVTKPVPFPCFGVLRKQKHILLPSVADIVMNRNFILNLWN